MVSFGYKTVSQLEKDNLVKGVFDRVAPKYDLMNNLMSFGSHKTWKKLFVKAMKLRNGLKILDMSAGTGDISMEILKQNRHVKVFAVDPSIRMVKEGTRKLTDGGYVNICWIIGRGEATPIASSSMDLYVMAFGLRNVTDIDKTLGEAKRVLKKGGQLMCLEFMPPSMGSLQSLYDFYSFKILPLMGQVVVGNGQPYKYLAESIRTFPPPCKLKSMLQSAGFVDVDYQDWNLVALHKGRAS